jgi:hypothetical protein
MTLTSSPTRLSYAVARKDGSWEVLLSNGVRAGGKAATREEAMRAISAALREATA